MRACVTVQCCLSLIYLEGCDDAGDRVDDVDKQLDDVRLQDADVSVVRLLDQNEEEDEGDDAEDEQQDATEQSLVRLRTVNLCRVTVKSVAQVRSTSSVTHTWYWCLW